MTQITATGFVVSDVSAQVGAKAPQFSLPCARGTGGAEQVVSLADFRCHWLVLLFYPLDFSELAASELLAFAAHDALLRARDVELLGVSTDSVLAHQAWLTTPRDRGGLEGLPYPLASDATHAVSRAYGVLIEDKGHALPGTFIVDPNGMLRYAVVHDLSVGRSTQETLRVLAALQSGEVRAADWEPTAAPRTSKFFGPRS